jgi:tRNA pseudouridine13 synthase
LITLSKSGRLLRGLTIGDFRYQQHELQLGELQGNQFRIVLRNCKFPRSGHDCDGSDGDDGKQLIEQRIQTFQSDGFINYFGLQRFGTHQTPTHHVGRAVLAGDYERAVRLILDHDSNSNSNNSSNISFGAKNANDFAKEKEARRVWRETGDAKAAHDLMPARFVAENALLASLAKNAGSRNWRQAFDQIPRNLRYLYENAYQSYLWNSAASARIKLYGVNQVVIGDLVAITTGDDDTSTASAVKLIETAEECEQYSVGDLVLPLPGSTVQYPTNQIGTVYKELLAYDGMNNDNFSFIPGTYRHLLVRPEQLKWQFAAYADPSAPLDFSSAAEAAEAAKDVSYLALIIQFNLPFSSYATMALRELMHLSTEKDLHASLNEHD